MVACGGEEEWELGESREYKQSEETVDEIRSVDFLFIHFDLIWYRKSYNVEESYIIDHVSSLISIEREREESLLFYNDEVEYT